MSVPKTSQRKKILVVDDDTDDRELFVEALLTVGSEVICYSAADGQEAIHKLETMELPDIIFLDLNMPVMDGWDCLNRLKSTEHYKSIPVIIHTTSSRDADKKLAKELGAICFFTKPDDYKKLRKMLEIVVEQLNKDRVETICEAVHQSLHLN